MGDEYPDLPDAQATLRTQLQSLRLKQLRHHAGAEGLDEDAIDDALDGDNPKAALIDLLVEREAARGPTERVLSTLEGSGDASAEMPSGVLDHAIEVLEQVSMSSPRKARRSLRDISDRADAVMESIDEEWCDGVSRCGREELTGLSGMIVRVRDLTASSAVSEVSDGVACLLDCIDRCGSVVVQSIGSLNAGSDIEDAAEAGLLSALESLRGLSESRLESVCADEAAAYEAVKSHMSGLESCVGAEVVSTCMALFTLGCRNGLSVCGTVDMVELSSGIYIQWLEAASGVDAVDYAAGAASSCAWHPITIECGPKTPSESRGPLEKAFGTTVKTAFGTVGKVFTERRVREIFTGSMRAGILSDDDVSLACGWSAIVFLLGFMFPASLSAADEAGVFSGTGSTRRYSVISHLLFGTGNHY